MPELTKEIVEPISALTRTTRVIMGRLEKAIENGVYADGDQLPAERQLAITFGTARSTIRKVLDELEKKNLVVRRVGSGTFVNYAGPRHQGLEDIADLVSPLQLIETRFAVEPYMTRLASIHATKSDLDRIEDVLRRLEGPGIDQNLFTQLDSEFHLELARCSRNPLIVRIYQEVNMVRLHAQWDRMKKLILLPEKISSYNRQHRAIFEALEQRDPQAAAELVSRHLEQARQDLMGAEI
ncbi:FadR/GntR family transcriptional regulator [Aestuariivirga sp.]|uniref:FadR/GntR family transcriptional regulator n=1 Tax=Aestuariivirga sp. TaxID=2650926 RepID=UPI00391A8277